MELGVVSIPCLFFLHDHVSSQTSEVVTLNLFENLAGTLSRFRYEVPKTYRLSLQILDKLLLRLKWSFSCFLELV